MAFKVINKINSRLRFLYRKKLIFITVFEKPPMQCNNSTTFRLCLLSLVSKPEQKIQKQIANNINQIH